MPIRTTLAPIDSTAAEQVLILRAQLGSRDAFVQLAERYDERLLFYIRRLLRSPSDAEDVRQDVWLTVLSKLRTLKEPAAFRTWLYRVARHQAISVLRRQRAFLDLNELAPHDEPAIDTDAADDDGWSPNDVYAIMRALDTLSTQHREILGLRFTSGLNYEQIAIVTGAKVGTVRSRIHYAKQALRHAMQRNAHQLVADRQPIAPVDAIDHNTSDSQGRTHD